MILYWRDAVEVTQQLFSNPIFTRSMDMSPYRHHSVDNDERVYGEFMSGDMAWEYAVRLHIITIDISY